MLQSPFFLPSEGLAVLVSRTKRRYNTAAASVSCDNQQNRLQQKFNGQLQKNCASISIITEC